MRIMLQHARHNGNEEATALTCLNQGFEIGTQPIPQRLDRSRRKRRAPEGCADVACLRPGKQTFSNVSEQSFDLGALGLIG